jgi:hypothetical protein
MPVLALLKKLPEKSWLSDSKVNRESLPKIKNPNAYSQIIPEVVVVLCAELS